MHFLILLFTTEGTYLSSSVFKYVCYWFSTLRGMEKELAFVGWRWGITRSPLGITAKLKIQKGSLLSIFCTVTFCVSFSKTNSVQHAWKGVWHQLRKNGENCIKAFRQTLVKDSGHDPKCWNVLILSSQGPLQIAKEQKWMDIWK